MVNQIQATPILIEGRGFKALDTGNYKPGEFRQLQNVEILDGRLVGRRDIYSCYQEVDSISPLSYSEDANNLGVIGHFNKWSIVAGRGFQKAISTSGVAHMWNPEELMYGFSSPGFRQLQGFFKYNYTNYWITLSYGTTEISLDLLFASETGTDNPSDYTYASLTGDTPIVTVDTFNKAYRDFKHNNFFIFKDRLCICNSDGIYFSRATDPTKFSVLDDGGFFKFPGTRVNYAIALKDTIYVLCESSVYAITYSTGPNDDATIREISNVVGGDHGCVFRDSVYFINNEGIFSLNNNYVEKVIDNKFDMGINNYDRQTLTPWREYIVVNNSYVKNPLGIASNAPTGTVYNYAFNPSFQYLGGPIRPYYFRNYDTINTEYKAVPSGSEYADIRVNGLSTGPHSLTFTCSDDSPSMAVQPNTDYRFSLDIEQTEYGDGVPFNSNIIIYAVFMNAAGLIIDYSGTSSILFAYGIKTRAFSNFTTTDDVVFINFSISFYRNDNVSYSINDVFRFSQKMLVKGHQEIDFFYGETPPITGIIGYVDDLRPEASASILTNSGVSYNNYLVPYFDTDKAASTGNALGVNTLFLNMDSGTVHTVDFADKYFKELALSVSASNEGRISQVVFNPHVDSLGNSTLFFITSQSRDETDYLYSGYFYMNPEYSDLPYDTSPMYKDSDGKTYMRRYRPEYLIELAGISPDLFKYDIKKFRNLEIISKFPSELFKFNLAYDNQSYSDSIDISDPVILDSDTRPHFSHRIGLNQRAKSISILLGYKDIDSIHGDPISDGVSTYDKLEISQMRLLWAPTLRSATSRSTF